VAGKKPKGKSSKISGLEDGATPFRGDFGERLRWLLDQFETRKEAGKVARITAEYLPSYIKAKANPRFASIARLAAAKNVSLDWLASGTGSRWTGEADADGYVGIALQPEADARFDEAETPAEILFARGWLKATTAAAPDELRLVVHRGKSNEPVIRDGDLLLVDIRVKRIAEDGLYVFPRDGKYLARVVEHLFDNRIALKPRHPDFGTQTLTKEEAERLPLLGRVLWRGGVP
jgi:hypothetical protein